MSNDTALSELTWDLGPLVMNKGVAGVDELLDLADKMAEELQEGRGRVETFDSDELVSFMTRLGELREAAGRAASYAGLHFSADMSDPERGALMQRVQERLTAVSTKLTFFELEWAAIPDSRAEELLEDERLDFCGHYLRNARRYRPHLLTEPEERVMTEKSVTGQAAWDRLFGELTSAISVTIDGQREGLEVALSRLHSPDSDTRRTAAQAVTEGLSGTIKTRAFIFNTLLQDKSVDDRLRKYDTWLQSRNLSNEASDESVEALIKAVRDRYDIPQRWYQLKARVMGVDRIADFDRMSSLAADDEVMEWPAASQLVLDSYRSFSTDLAAIVERFYEGNWIDVPPSEGKRPGAFCHYTVPSVNPYILLNYTSRRRDALTLAHELGHGVHSYLARVQGIFHQGMPLTVAETASVFGETVVFNRLLTEIEDPNQRFALLAERVEDALATVFRQVAMNRFEELVHTARRTEGELTVERFGDLWTQSQTELFGDTVEITDGYRTWWSYIPHFISTPGYVYAYAFGQLLALAVYKRYEEQGASFVPRYLEMLSAGGSLSPEELARLVDCDLEDAGFWNGGLTIINDAVDAAETAARGAGRLE